MQQIQGDVHVHQDTEPVLTGGELLKRYRLRRAVRILPGQHAQGQIPPADERCVDVGWRVPNGALP